MNKLLFTMLLLTLYKCIAQDTIGVKRDEDLYLLKIHHTNSTYPEYSLMGYYLVHPRFFQEKLEYDGKNLFESLELNGGKKNYHESIYLLASDLIIACCEAQNIFQGFENYNSHIYSSELVSRYNEMMKSIHNSFDKMRYGLQIADKTETYKIAVYEVDIEYCFCNSVSGGDEKYAYIRNLESMKKIKRSLLSGFKVKIHELAFKK